MRSIPGPPGRSPTSSKVTGHSHGGPGHQDYDGRLSERHWDTPPACGKSPPYYAVKVPVFSFEKITDANAILGPEMKSTGEVLGLGRTFNEALFKGFAAAGYRHYMGKGVLLSVENHELPEVVGLAKKFDDLKMPMYATADTASAIRSLGIQVHEIPPLSRAPRPTSSWRREKSA